jgi:predicted secreted hydrolase
MTRHHTLVLVSVLALLVCRPLSGQESEPNYRRALPGYEYEFPRDHGAHPDYKLEWWYYTGHLFTDAGRSFGYELTFFRFGMDQVADNPSAWNVRDLHVAHFALSEPEANDDSQRFRFYERVNRGGPGIAHVSEETLDVGNESWTARLDGDVMKLRAYADGILLELELRSDKPPAIHGIDGVSQKADGVGQASHYYSMTRMETSGLVSIDGDAQIVTGESWMDHEFGTSQLAPEQVGWDWFSLQLDNGQELMLYQIRRSDGGIDHNSSGTVVAEDGPTRHLTSEQFSVDSFRSWESPETGAVYALDWAVEIPGENTRLRVTPRMDGQEMATIRSTGFPYWEGSVQVEGTWRGEPVLGQGYVELTGYGDGHRPEI